MLRRPEILKGRHSNVGASCFKLLFKEGSLNIGTFGVQLCYVMSSSGGSGSGKFTWPRFENISTKVVTINSPGGLKFPYACGVCRYGIYFTRLFLD